MEIKTEKRFPYRSSTSSVKTDDDWEESMLLSIFTGRNSFLLSQYNVILLDDDSLDQFQALKDDDFRLEECNDC